MTSNLFIVGHRQSELSDDLDRKLMAGVKIVATVLPREVRRIVVYGVHHQAFAFALLGAVDEVGTNF